MLYKNRLFWTGETKSEDDDEPEQDGQWDGPLTSEVITKINRIFHHIIFDFIWPQSSYPIFFPNFSIYLLVYYSSNISIPKINLLSFVFSIAVGDTGRDFNQT